MNNLDRRYGVTDGLAIKAPCVAATTAAITLFGLQTVDGVALAEGDRVLVKNQADTTANGVYVAHDSLAWSRDLDFDGYRDAVNGTFVPVAIGGAVNGGSLWQLSATNPVSFGTTALSFVSAITATSMSFLQAGTGAVARTVQNKERDVVSVLDFGADQTGVADSSTAFTNAGSSSSIPIVIVPNGIYKLSSIPAPSGAVTWVISSGASFTGVGVGTHTPLPGYNAFDGGSVSPIGNATSTQIGIAAQAVNTQTAKREMAGAFGLYADKGNGQGSPNGDKVAIFGGVDSANGSLNIWGLNTSTIIGAGNTTNQGAWGYELDLNNHSAHYGNAVYPTGFSAPASYGIAVTGVSDFNNTAAIVITQSSGAGKWNRGLVFLDHIAQSDIESHTTATKWAYLAGTYSYGLDLLDAGITNSAIRLANGHLLSARNATNSADIAIVSVNGSNDIVFGSNSNHSVVIGSGSTSSIIVYQSVLPATDNALNLGSTANRWGNLYISGSTFETSKTVTATNGLTAYTASTKYNYLTGTAGASFAITLPAAAAAIDGELVVIMSTALRAATTWASAGATFVGAPAALAANTPVKLQYDHGTTAWHITA